MISCIITTYKRPINIVKRAIESVVHQTYKDIELIVVNDDPEDVILSKELDKLLDSYDVSKQYLIHHKNQGACAARNTGIVHAKGEYIAFLDDDDEWLPEKLERQLSIITKNDVALVYCSHYEIGLDGTKKLIEEDFAEEGLHDNDFEKLLCFNYIGSTSYPLIKKHVLEVVGGFTVGLKSSQDHDLWLRIAEKYPIMYCNKPLVKYYYSSEAISRSITNKLQGYEYLLDKYHDVYVTHKDIFNYRLNYLAYCCFKFNAYKKFISYWSRAIRIKPISRQNFMLFSKALKRISRK